MGKSTQVTWQLSTYCVPSTRQGGHLIKQPPCPYDVDSPAIHKSVYWSAKFPGGWKLIFEVAAGWELPVLLLNIDEPRDGVYFLVVLSWAPCRVAGVFWEERNVLIEWMNKLMQLLSPRRWGPQVRDQQQMVNNKSMPQSAEEILQPAPESLFMGLLIGTPSLLLTLWLLNSSINTLKFPLLLGPSFTYLHSEWTSAPRCHVISNVPFGKDPRARWGRHH